jgi:hypothetical protein
MSKTKKMTGKRNKFTKKGKKLKGKVTKKRNKRLTGGWWYNVFGTNAALQGKCEQFNMELAEGETPKVLEGLSGNELQEGLRWWREACNGVDAPDDARRPRQPEAADALPYPHSDNGSSDKESSDDEASSRGVLDTVSNWISTTVNAFGRSPEVNAPAANNAVANAAAKAAANNAAANAAAKAAANNAAAKAATRRVAVGSLDAKRQAQQGTQGKYPTTHHLGGPKKIQNKRSEAARPLHAAHVLPGANNRKYNGQPQQPPQTPPPPETVQEPPQTYYGIPTYRISNLLKEK